MYDHDDHHAWELLYASTVQLAIALGWAGSALAMSRFGMSAAFWLGTGFL